jgi:diamine N-acetyltransferase
MPVTLAEITAENVAAVYDLELAPGQDEFVASNPWSLAQALAEHHIAWPRAIVDAEGEVVGFLMLEIDPDESNGRHFWVWRLMVAARHQRKGHGTAALALAFDEIRRRGGDEVYTSRVEDEGGPGPFYLRLGFVPTGELDDDEIVARLTL